VLLLLQLSGPIGVLGLAFYRAFEFCVFLFTIAYGVRMHMQGEQAVEQWTSTADQQCSCVAMQKVLACQQQIIERSTGLRAPIGCIRYLQQQTMHLMPTRLCLFHSQPTEQMP